MPFYHSFTSDLISMCQQNKRNKLQKNVIYSILSDKNTKKLIGYQMYIENEGIRIIYPSKKNNPMRYLYIIVNVSVFLNKDTLEESDCAEFKAKYNDVVYRRLFFYDDFLKSEVFDRIDYKFDYYCKDKNEKTLLLGVARKVKSKRYSAKKRIYLDNENNAETIYYNGKQYRINIYDKDEESGGNPKYSNMIRYEVQVLTRTLQRYIKDYGIIRDIDNYWNMRDYFFSEFIFPVLYLGDYYKNNIVSRMLNGSRNKNMLLSKFKQLQLSKSIDGLFSYNQLKQLERLNINPLQGNFNLINPLKSIKK